METIWLSPTAYVTSDPTLKISYPSVSHPHTIVTSKTKGDLKWISLGLPLLQGAQIEEVTLCYQVSDPRSFISQVRLSEMATPEQALVRHDDPTDLTSTSPARYTSRVSDVVTTVALMLDLRLNFQNTKDQILLGAVGVTIQSTDGCSINVKDYGAMGDGKTDDASAIQRAIEAAKALNKTTVCLPPGRYRLTRAIRPEVNNFTLLGAAGTILIADPADGERFPEAILVNKGLSSIGEEVYRVTIQDMTIEVNNGADGETSAGVIQLNNCKDCLVRNVYMKYTGRVPKPKNIDGIVTANGTSGLIQGCVVDGIPKAGIYIAQGSSNVQVEGCEVRNTTGPLGQVGISISGSDRIIINNCFSHHNGGAGLLIAVNGPIGENQPVAATNVQVIGGMYHDNGIIGIWVGSGSNQIIPANIQLVGVTTLNNAFRGIQVEAGWDVLIASPTVMDSGNAGIWVENRPGVATFDDSQFDPAHPRTTRVQISNPQVYDNGHTVGVDVPAIGLTAVDQVTITGGKLYKTPLRMDRRQNYGIGLNKNSIGATCTNLRILDVDAAVGHKKPVAPLHESTMLEDLSAAASSGYYRLQSVGNPEGVLSAPVGSEYVDLGTGRAYRKATSSGLLGWIQTFPMP